MTLLSPTYFFVLALAFISGSIPFGFLIGKFKGKDIRKEGSGNIGATNVWRTFGPRWGSLAFLLDFLKGLLPVIYAMHRLYADPQVLQIMLVSIAVAALLGANFTPWLGGKGGKGIATSAGVLAALLPMPLILILCVWAVFFMMTRIVSLASLASSVTLPLATFIFYPQSKVYVAFSMIACLLSLWRHRPNITRLLKGTEPSFRKK